MKKWSKNLTAILFAFLLVFFPNGILIADVNAAESDVNQQELYDGADESLDQDAALDEDSMEETYDHEDSVNNEDQENEENIEEDNTLDENVDDDLDVSDLYGTAKGDIKFDYSNGFYTLEGHFGITNFSSQRFSDPWIAFALPSGVDIASELPSGIEAVMYEGELYIVVKLADVGAKGSAVRFEDLHLIGNGSEANPNYDLFLAEYTDEGFIFHGQLKSQREIDFGVMDGIPDYNLVGDLTGKTTFKGEERNYTLNVNGQVINNEKVDIKDVYVSFVIPEDVMILENDEEVQLLNKDDGTTELAIKLDELKAGETTLINLDIPVIGMTNEVVEANEINLYKIENTGYWELASFPGSVEIDFSDMDQEWTFDAVAQIVKDFPEVQDNQFGLQFAFDSQNLTIEQVDKVIVEFDVPTNIQVHAPDEYTSGDIPDALKDFLKEGTGSGNLDIEWEDNKAIIYLDDVIGTQWNQGYFTAIGESSENIDDLEGLEVIVTLLQNGSDIVKELNIPFEIVSYDDGSDEQDPEPEVDTTALEAIIAEAKDLNSEDYTDESFANVETALETAESVLADDEATQEEVDEASTALEKAIEDLEEKEETPKDPEPEVDTSALEAIIVEAKDLNSEDYTDESFANVETALETAESVLANDEATQEEVDEASTALEKAIEDLEEKEETPKDPEPEVDTSALEAIIVEAKDLNSEDYTDESFANVETALETAESVLANDEATQEEVDEASTALKKAIEDLEEKEELVDDSKTSDDQDAGIEIENVESGDKLPNTATSMYTILLIGSLLIFAGVALFLTFRRRQIG